MVAWALLLMIAAIIAGVFGFGGFAATTALVGKIAFGVLLAVSMVLFIAGLARGRPKV
ncbi:MAG: DUF1328 domain-containing protein [Chitinivibrionales bacterium]